MIATARTLLTTEIVIIAVWDKPGDWAYCVG
jgi:hypothetical protein